MRGGENDIKLPVVELDLLATNTAHSVDYHQGVRADGVHKLAEGLDFAEYTGARVDVCDGQDLVLLLLECFLHLIELWSVADGCLQLCGFCAICFEAVGKRVGKIASVQNKDVIARLGEIRGNLVPAEGARAREDEGLRGRVGGLEELAQVGEDVAKCVDEGLADVRFAVWISF